MEKDVKNDYLNKLKRFIATPHSAKAQFDAYQEENKETSFDEYTKLLEGLLDKLDEDKIKSQEELCKEVNRLKLPSNQFGC